MTWQWPVQQCLQRGVTMFGWKSVPLCVCEECCSKVPSGGPCTRKSSRWCWGATDAAWTALALLQHVAPCHLRTLAKMPYVAWSYRVVKVEFWDSVMRSFDILHNFAGVKLCHTLLKLQFSVGKVQTSADSVPTKWWLLLCEFNSFHQKKALPF